jgi:hypothetical protein
VHRATYADLILFLFCIGPFFPLENSINDYNLDEKISEYISGKKNIPIDTYFLSYPDRGNDFIENIDEGLMLFLGNSYKYVHSFMFTFILITAK